MTKEQVTALRMLAQVFVDAVREAGPQGAPSGPMYAACMDRLSLDQYEQIMSALVSAGRLRKAGHLYFAA